MTYLKRHPKTGTYIFRRAIPAQIQPLLDKGREWTESLRTKDATEAKRRVLPVAARVDALFQQASAQVTERKNGDPSLPLLTTPMIHGVIDAWKEQEEHRRAQAIMMDPIASGTAFDAELALYNHGNDSLDAGADGTQFFANLDRRDRFVDGKIKEIFRAAGLPIMPRHPAWIVISNLVDKAWREVLHSDGQWRNFEFRTMPRTEPSPFPQFGRGIEPAPSASATTISQALETWAAGAGARGAKKPMPGTAQEARAALRRFTELHGDLPITSISRAHGRQYRDAMATLPSRLPRDLAVLSISELVTLDLSALPRRSVTTLKKSLTLLGAVLSRADRDGHFDGMNWRNPFDVSVAPNGFEDDGYEPFTVAELNALFASPVFSHGLRPTGGRGCTAKWVPLLALLHGARRGEIMQLYVRDVFQDEETGTWAFRFDRDGGKSIKTASSVRQTPLHPVFVELGFLAFVEERRRLVGGEGSLWQGFEDRSKLSSRVNKWGEWFGRYLAANVVKADGKAFHSFRATFKRFGHDCHVPEPVLDRLVGHVVPGVGARYGRKRDASGRRDSGFPIQRLAREISRVRFRGVDFGKIV